MSINFVQKCINSHLIYHVLILFTYGAKLQGTLNMEESEKLSSFNLELLGF